MDLTKVAFEPITDRFSKGVYLGVEIIIDMTNGYVQGAGLCAQVKNTKGKAKQFRNWICTKQYVELCEYLGSSAGIHALEAHIADAPVNLRGIYIHPYLVPHCAQWASPTFAHKVGIILNEKAISEAIVEKDKCINNLNDSITKLNVKLDEQSKAITDQSRQIAELLGYAKTTKDELIETKEVLIETKDELIDTRETLDDTRDLVIETTQELSKTRHDVNVISNKLGIVRQEVVVPDIKTQNRFVFCVYKHKDDANKYKVFRCQKKSMSQSIKTCRDKDFTIQVYKIESPNPINLWNRVRANFPVEFGKIKSLYNVELSTGTTQEQFLEFLTKTNGEKMEYGE